jgi:hypothetical protein
MQKPYYEYNYRFEDVKPMVLLESIDTEDYEVA